MIYPCNFKSKVFKDDARGCNLTPDNDTCPGEQHCILYQLYSMLSEGEPQEETLSTETKQTVTTPAETL